MSTCYATCCSLEQTEKHRPYCSEPCKRLTRAVVACPSIGPKRLSVLPEIAPWSWLDARAGRA